VSQRPLHSRAFWIRQTILWHWVSSGVCLAGMLLFTVTGITLNHASAISAKPVVARKSATLPPPLRASLQAAAQQGKHPVPAPVLGWMQQEFGIRAASQQQNAVAEWSETEVYVSLPRPGGDAWVTLDRETFEARYETTDRGWISYFNDLHKGRHTGPAWQIFIDVIAAGCLIFTITGLVMLQIHAAKRPSTWPLVTLGMLVPFLLMLFLVHR
jgi:uncharacterized protein